MSRFSAPLLEKLAPYVPGEQPQTGSYIKLNTNESPFPPSPKVTKVLAGKAETMRLYPDPECRALTKAVASTLGIQPEQVIMGNGSDEILAFIFQALCPKGAAFPDITYGFYKVWAQLYDINTKVVPLRKDFTLDLNDYRGFDETLIIANPNAPTGIANAADDIAKLAAEKPDRLIVVDEAYVDFGAESCLKYIDTYDNILVVQTYSKSRNLAGGRVAFAAGNKALISDLNRIKFSFHPYSVSRLSQLAGIAAVEDREYFEKCTSSIIKTRARAARELKALGFEMTESRANFLFVRHPKLSGERLYRALREKGVLVRYFGSERIEDFLRITVGSDEETDALIKALGEILKA